MIDDGSAWKRALNPMTLFAVRLCSAAVVFLTPLLRQRQTLFEFLAQTAITSLHLDPDRQQTDRCSYEYWTVTQPNFAARFFGGSYDDLLRRIDCLVCNVYYWLERWMYFATGMAPEDWTMVDGQLQRLYFILDHETPPHWPNVVCNHRYHGLVARALVFCLEMWLTDEEV